MNEITVPLVIGQVMPYVIDLGNRYVANSRVRFWVSVLACLSVGVLMNYNELLKMTWQDAEEIMKFGGLVFLSAQSAYKTYYEDSQFHHKIKNPN